METEVYANDGGDGVFLNLRELVQEHLTLADCERLIACGLYAVYQNTEPDKRAQELYDYLNRTFFRGTQVEAILSVGREELVSGQHRRHYDSVAALAATLGEVRESRGKLSAKDQILLNYRAEFPRHSSFHAELRAYGMPDTRKR